MKVIVQDVNCNNIRVEALRDSEDPDIQRISILEVYGATEIVLDLEGAYRLGSALRLLSKVAEREDEQRRETTT